MKQTIKHAMLSMIIFIFTAGSALAADTLKYTGEIADDAGNPLNGEYLMTFSLYDDPQGYIIWEETQEVVVQDGHYEVVLGSNNPLNFPEDKEYYLEVTLGGSPELAAQDIITPTGKKPKSFKKPVQIKDWLLVGSTSYTPSAKLEVNPDGIEDDGDEFVVDYGGNVGIGTTGPNEKLEVDGAIKLGNTTRTNAGTIRWTGTAFEGYNGTDWIKLGAPVSDAPYFDSGWFFMSSQAGTNSYKEITHDLGDYPSRVKVLVRAIDGANEGFIFEGSGVQHQDDDRDKGDHGGVVFAYDQTRVRIWAPSKNNTSDYGRIINILDGWGGEVNSQRSQTAQVKVLVWR